MAGYTFTHRSDHGATKIADSLLENMWRAAVLSQMSLDESIAERTFERGGRLYLRAA